MAACSDGTTGLVEPEVGTLMVDASTKWTFVRLGETADTVAVAQPGTSTVWDLAFFSTGVMLNGGEAGPKGVIGHCICQNRGSSDAQILAMTPESELADFEAVTATSIPAADSLWKSDALTPAITGWWSYNPVTHQVSADPTKTWKIRLAEATNPGFAKFRVTGLANATQTSAGRVTIEYATQTSVGATMSATKSAVLDATSGRVYFDFARGTTTDANDWDIALEGYAIRINGGASGSGLAGAVLASESFGSMTDASDAPATIYRSDAYGGVFDAHRWYKYNLTGNNDIAPTYDVFLIKRGAEVYKVQLIGYYNAAGQSRRITFRYARLTD
jgi:hypothetical protein